MKDIQFSDKAQRRFYRILSFLIPFGVMLICFTMLGMYPLGNKGPALLGDAVAEYYPFQLLLRRIIANGESLLYTWRVGLGSDVVPNVISQFCMSPINLLGLLLPESMYAHYLSLSICVRFGLTGYFLAILMQQISGKADASVPVFCTAYALNMWMMTYYWQTILLGPVTLTPLVLLGLLKLVRDRDMRLYPLMLGLSMLIHYYMTFFTAIICGFFWIGLMIVLDKSWREVPRELGKFLGLSVLGAGFSLVILLPAFSAISVTGNFADNSIHWTEFYTDFITLTGQLVSGVLPHINDQPADFAGSILLVVLVLGYLTTSRIRLRERIYTLVVALILFFSLTYSPLNLLFHGMHYPYVTVQRYAYLLPLVLAFMGWRYTQNMHPEKLPEDASGRRKAGRVLLTIVQFALMGVGAAGACWCAYSADLTDVILLPLCVAGVILLLYLIYRCFPKTGLFFHIGLLVVVTAEMMLNSWVTISRNMASLEGNKQIVQPVETISQALSDIAADAEGQLFYRSGLYEQPSNTELLYEGIKGGAYTFSSLIPYDLMRLSVALGMNNKDASTKYYDFSSLLPMSTLLTDMQYLESDAPSVRSLVLYEPLNGDADTANAYRFRYDTALGFLIPENISLDALPDTGATDVQDALANLMTGEQEKMMEQMSVPFRLEQDMVRDTEASLGTDGVLHTKTGELPESSDAEEDPDAEAALHSSVSVQVTIPEDGTYWLSLQHDKKMQNAVKRWTVKTGDTVLFDESLNLLAMKPIIFAENNVLLGDLKAGTEVSLTYYLLPDSEGEVEMKLIRFREDVFGRVYDKLMQSPFTLTEFDQDTFTGTVTAESNALLYLSVPYRKGWTAYVDGVETSIVPVLDAMSGIQLMAGTHTIRLEYHQPLLLEGALATGLFIVIYLLLVFIQQTKRYVARKRGFLDDAPMPEPPAPVTPQNDTPKQATAPTVPRIPAPMPEKPKAPAVPEKPVEPEKPTVPEKPVPPQTEPAKEPEKPVTSPQPEPPIIPRPADTSRGKGRYEHHKPQRLTAEDEAEARFVKGAHFADSDEDDDAND